MLDAFAYPVSVLMMVCHRLISLVVDPASGTAWVVSILLLVCTVRLLLVWPAWKQLVTARRTAALRPRLLALKKAHADNSTAYAAAARQLHRDEGVGALGCLPLLLQLPVFLGLYHLLAGFTSVAGTGSNGAFGPDQVHSFAHATVFGVPLSVAVRTPVDVLGALQPGLGLGGVLAVVAPVLVIAATATFVNAHVAARRQTTSSNGGDPTAVLGAQVSRTMVWFAPLSVFVGGLLFPVPLALMLYWAINGTWTTVQTVLLNRRLDQRPATPMDSVYGNAPPPPPDQA